MPVQAALVQITGDSHGVVIDLVYAGDANFTGRAIYDHPLCFLHPEAEACLRKAVIAARGLGLGLKIFDAFRPHEAQEALWAFAPDPDYIADPKQGSNHTRGVALDLTLVDDRGEALDMGTPVDTMSAESHHFYPAHPASVQVNRMKLLTVMLEAGFVHHPREWWHYQLPDAQRFPLVGNPVNMSCVTPSGNAAEAVQRADPPEPLLADKNLRYDQLLKAAKRLPRIRMGVVHPCSRESLEGALDAARLGLIEAILIGPEPRIRSLAKDCQLDLSGFSIVDVPHSHAAADKGVEMARSGEVDALMKGSLHSDELLGAVVNAQTGLRTARRVTHVFVLDVPRYPTPLLITDAAINVAPDFDAKVDIVQNAIDLAHALGIARPKVAILSAVETVTPKLRSSMDAAALSKMADRGQITGGLVDGPLAFDNAVSLAAAKTKGIASEVAGQADILVVPDLESGNMLAKQLEYLGGAQAAGVVMGARVPIVLTSRADSAHSRIASCAITLLLVSHRLRSEPKALA